MATWTNKNGEILWKYPNRMAGGIFAIRGSKNHQEKRGQQSLKALIWVKKTNTFYFAEISPRLKKNHFCLG